MKTVFDYQVRVLLCENCGAPLEAMPSAPVVRCKHCNAENRVGVRTEGFSIPQRHVSEPERIGRLRMQDGRPLVAPQSIAHLIEGGDIPPWRLQEAVAVWQSARRELRAAPSNHDAAERLLFLTLALSNQFTSSHDLMRARAMYESALEVFAMPRHRQMMYGFLSRLAAREGDLESAEAWLRPCDPRPDDLESDTAFRVSRALIETARGRYQEVGNLLGWQHEAVPILDAFDPIASIIRANALERMGNVQGAADLVRAALAAGPQARLALEGVRNAYSRFAFCQQSFPHAMAAHCAVVAERGAASAGGGAGMMILIIGGISVVGGLAIFAVTMAATPSMPGSSGGFTFGLGSLGFLIPLVIIVPIAMKLIRSSQKTKRILQFGVPATGRVVGLSPTGMLINGVPKMQVRVMVILPDRPPYEASTELLLDAMGQARLASGGQIPIKIDPQSPTDIALDM